MVETFCRLEKYCVFHSPTGYGVRHMEHLMVAWTSNSRGHCDIHKYRPPCTSTFSAIKFTGLQKGGQKEWITRLIPPPAGTLGRVLCGGDVGMVRNHYCIRREFL